MAPQVRCDDTEASRELLDVSVEEPGVDGTAMKEHERLPLTLSVVPYAAASQSDHSRHADSVVEECNHDRRAQLHRQIVRGWAGAVYSPTGLRLRSQPDGHNAQTRVASNVHLAPRHVQRDGAGQVPGYLACRGQARQRPYLLPSHRDSLEAPDRPRSSRAPGPIGSIVSRGRRDPSSPRRGWR